MKEDSMLMCLICFVLGYLFARMMRGNGMMVGGQLDEKKDWKCEYNGKLPKDICFDYYYGNCIHVPREPGSQMTQVDVSICKSTAKKKCIHSDISSSEAKIFAKKVQKGCSKSSNTPDGKCKGSRKTGSRLDSRIVGDKPYNPYCMNVKVTH